MVMLLITSAYVEQMCLGFRFAGWWDFCIRSEHYVFQTEFNEIQLTSALCRCSSKHGHCGLLIWLVKRTVETLGKQLIMNRNSHQRCSIKEAFLKNFAIFTGKHLCWSLLLIKLQAFKLVTLLKRNSNTSIFL